MKPITIQELLRKLLRPAPRPKAPPRRRSVQLRLEYLEERAVPAAFTVTSAADDGTSGTFRYALQQLNASSDPTNTIDFAIGASGSRQTITVNQSLGQLPIIEKPVTIDGSSQGSSSSGPLIQLDGTHTMMIPGLDVSVGGVTIQDLAVYGFMGSGVYINNEGASTGDVVRGCYVGTDAAGDSGLGNGTGVSVLGSGDTIGGPQTTDTNVISGNKQDGVLLEASDSLVMNDWIGVSPTGLAALANGTGVLVEGATDTVGDATGAVLTLVSGNTNDGIDVSGTGALITNTWVGVNLTGLAALPNGGNGIALDGDGSSDNDVVSGNTGDGILVTGSSNVIYGDMIGVGKDGATQVANGDAGVVLDHASQNFVGSATQDKNIISGNTAAGVAIIGGSNNLVINNWIGIGTGPNGTIAVANEYGVVLSGSTSGNTIGGTTAAARNVISGNTSYGVWIWDGSTNNTVEGNFIGLSADGTTPMGNGLDGVYLDSNNNTIGGSAANTANVISANGLGAMQPEYGVYMSATSQGNLVDYNDFGTDSGGTEKPALDNRNGGVEDASSGNNTIGTHNNGQK